MEKAAKKAEDAGHHVLADAIRQEVTGYRKSPRVRACEVYGEITDTVLGASFRAPFLDIIEHVAYRYGISRSEFLRRYPRARTVFDKAVKLLERQEQSLKRLAGLSPSPSARQPARRRGS